MDELVAAKTENVPVSPWKWRILAVLLILFLIGIVFFWRFMQQPSQGTVTVVPSVEKKDAAAPEHRKRYQGKYFTFTYPYDFNRREETESVKFPLLERIFLSRSDVEGRKIALTIQDNTGNSFEEYSSFRIRRADPTVYHEETIKKNGEPIVLFTKESVVFEVSAFFGRGNQVLSITVSSPTTLNNLREEVLAILDTFEWNTPEKGSQ